jgi:hypothetical protein
MNRILKDIFNFYADLLETVFFVLYDLSELFRKYVTPSVSVTTTLSVSQGPTGTAYNLVIVALENGQPDTTDQASVIVLNPDGTETVLANVPAPDSTGTTTIPLAAGTESGAYVYTPTVGGDVGPTATFTRINSDTKFLASCQKLVYFLLSDTYIRHFCKV